MENQQSSSTASAILEAGKKEFLTFGYEKASLRRIAAEASVTTGAIYGCFSGKEAIFEALTGEVSQTLVDMYTNVHREFAVLSPEKQVEELDDTLVHILCRSFFQQLQEFISHDLPRERALSCALLLGRFQHAGWAGILNL